MCPECAAGRHMKCESIGNGKVCGGPHDMMMATLTEETEGDAVPDIDDTGGSYKAFEMASKLKLGGGGIKSLLDGLIGGMA